MILDKEDYKVMMQTYGMLFPKKRNANKQYRVDCFWNVSSKAVMAARVYPDHKYEGYPGHVTTVGLMLQTRRKSGYRTR